MTARNGLLVTYGQSVLTLDAETGECVLRRDLGEEVLLLLEAAPDHYVAVLGSGQTVSVFYSPRRVIYYKQFAGGISMALLPPAEAVDYEKRQNLQRAGAAIGKIYRAKDPVRFDIIEVYYTSPRDFEINHIVNAF